MERLVETLFNIDIFSFDEAEPLDKGIQYTEVQFMFKSLKKYDGNCIEVNSNWDITVWSDEGEQIDQFNLITVPEFKETLLRELP
jgi:hypothetical protein